MVTRKREIFVSESKNGSGDSKECNTVNSQSNKRQSSQKIETIGNKYLVGSVVLLIISSSICSYLYLSYDVERLYDDFEKAYYALHDLLNPYAAEDSGRDGNLMLNKDKTSAKPTTENYAKASITNSEDYGIRQIIDNADLLIEKNLFDDAIKALRVLKKKYPKSPRVTYSLARALDGLANEKKSNPTLELAIDEYRQVLDTQDLPKALALEAAERAADRMVFRGWQLKAVKTYETLIAMYPDDYLLNNDLAVHYLIAGRLENARMALNEVLVKEPDNGFALAHLGFIYKTKDNNYKKAIGLLQRGIDSKAPGTIDGRFFAHLGDAYYRVGENDKAIDTYKAGADAGLFLSYWQRSLYNVDGLSAKPWWTKKETQISDELSVLESHWQEIRDEALAQLDPSTGMFMPEEEDLSDTGEWKQFTLFLRGKKNPKACLKAPLTCNLVEKIPAAKSCTRGQVKFSVMQPGVHVWPHVGPTNCRIRTHLGLVIPEGPRIRVTNDTRTWKEGEFIIFDDSFEHEVWHDGDSLRLVLIMDIWHPELSAQDRATLSPI